MIQILVDKKFDSDPVKKWREIIEKKQVIYLLFLVMH